MTKNRYHGTVNPRHCDEQTIEKALKVYIFNGRNIKKTSDQLGISRNTLKKWLVRYPLPKLNEEEIKILKSPTTVIIPEPELPPAPAIEIVDEKKRNLDNYITDLQSGIAKKMQSIIDNEDSKPLLPDLARALQILAQMDKDRGFTSTKKTNYIETITQQFKESQYDNEINRANGDSQESAGQQSA